MSTEPSNAAIKAAAAEAVGVFLRNLGDDLSTGKFVLLVESIDAEGERGLWAATGEDQTGWDTLGLLQYAMDREIEDDDA